LPFDLLSEVWPIKKTFTYNKTIVALSFSKFFKINLWYIFKYFTVHKK